MPDLVKDRAGETIPATAASSIWVPDWAVTVWVPDWVVTVWVPDSCSDSMGT